MQTYHSLITRFHSFIIVLGLLAGAASSPSFAQNFVEGKDYTRIIPAVPVRVDAGKIEVREFFWYGCPHCYTLEPFIEKWKKPAAVEFIRTPALLGKAWEAHAYAFYTLERLQRLDDLHPKLFDALHKKRLRLTTKNRLATFFAEHGIAEEQYLEVSKSMVVNAKINKAEHLGDRYDLRSVPTFVVNGKYLTSPSMLTGKSFDDFFDLIDYLVSLETNSTAKQTTDDQSNDEADNS